MIRSMAAQQATGRRICLLRQPTEVSAGRNRSNVMKYKLPGFVSCVSLSVLALLTLGGSLALAHHSAAATYIHGKSVKIEGTLKEFIWRNPHSFMKVQAPDDKGEAQLWVVEGAAPTQLAEGGVTRNTLKPGDDRVITGQPARIADDPRLPLEQIER